MAKLKDNHRKAIIFTTLTIVNIILFQFELGRMVLYPFTILGTWFHEMSHGIMAILNGGSFEKLEIFSDGSGIATSSGNFFLGRVSNALIAMAGPLGPTLFGYFFFRIAKNEKATNYGLWILSFIMILSIILWIRSIYGVVVISIFAALIIYTSLQKNKVIKEIVVLFLGLQACVSVYLSLDYLFISQTTIGNNVMKSDTGAIADALFLPHYFWGISIFIFSIFVLMDSFIRLFKNR